MTFIGSPLRLLGFAIFDRPQQQLSRATWVCSGSVGALCHESERDRDNEYQ
jgi:hypothetical protein